MPSAYHWCGSCSSTGAKIVFRVLIAIEPSVFERRPRSNCSGSSSSPFSTQTSMPPLCSLLAVTLQIHVRAPVWSVGLLSTSHSQCRIGASKWPLGAPGSAKSRNGVKRHQVYTNSRLVHVPLLHKRTQKIELFKSYYDWQRVKYVFQKCGNKAT